MESRNIVKKLGKDGYKVEYKKCGYWEAPYICQDGLEFAIAETWAKNGTSGIITNFVYNNVIETFERCKHFVSLLEKNDYDKEDIEMFKNSCSMTSMTTGHMGYYLDNIELYYTLASKEMKDK